MTTQTVPRPPIPDLRPPTMDAADRKLIIDWQAIAIILLTAIPVAVAWSSGMVVRCVALIVAAVRESYAAGRGLDHG